MRKIILFELNEVPFSIIDYYCNKFPQSELAKILPLSAQYETVTEDEGHLSPWITWPTLHRGVTNHLHEIHDFGEAFEAVDAKYPPIWKILADKGLKPAVFASMHSYPIPKNYKDYAFFVPDPFAGDSFTHPENLIPFQKFNLAMSRKSGRNVDGGIDMKAAAQLAVSLPTLGIKVNTLMEVAGQLVKERQQSWIKTRRRTYQSILAFDIFMKLMEKTQPSFTTYFSNHVASTMHRYWAASFPNDYKKNEMESEWLETYKDEIDFTLHKFDHFLKQMVKFVHKHPEYKLVVASSMGQAATKAEMLRTEAYMKSANQFFQFFGLNESDWNTRSAMHPQYNYQIEESKKIALGQKLSQVEIGDKPLSFREKEGGFLSVDLGHKNLDVDYAVYEGKQINFSKMGITNEPIEDQTGSTAYHVPEGSLFVYDPQDQSKKEKREGKITTTAIVPSLLENYQASIPSYMTDLRIEALQG